jgi:DNA repair protein RadC
MFESCQSFTGWAKVSHGGNLTPNEADIQLTRKLKEAGLMLDLPVLDHLIISSEGYYSFADEGLL